MSEHRLRMKEHQKPKKNNQVSRNRSYKAANYAIKKSGLSMTDMVGMMRYLYHNGVWSASYGGPAWGRIADGWLLLNRADKMTQTKKGSRTPPMEVAIDHVYDLQHNTDTVFNKLKSYYKDSSGYHWIKQALDKKANVTSYYDLLGDASGTVRILAKPVLYNRLGTTWEGPTKSTTPEDISPGSNKKPSENKEPGKGNRVHSEQSDIVKFEPTSITNMSKFQAVAMFNKGYSSSDFKPDGKYKVEMVRIGDDTYDVKAIYIVRFFLKDNDFVDYIMKYKFEFKQFGLNNVESLTNTTISSETIKNVIEKLKNPSSNIDIAKRKLKKNNTDTTTTTINLIPKGKGKNQPPDNIDYVRCLIKMKANIPDLGIKMGDYIDVYRFINKSGVGSNFRLLPVQTKYGDGLIDDKYAYSYTVVQKISKSKLESGIFEVSFHAPPGIKHSLEGKYKITQLVYFPNDRQYRVKIADIDSGATYSTYLSYITLVK